MSVSASPLGPSTSSAWSILPSFVTSNVTCPAFFTDGSAGVILNSVSESFTVSAAGAG